MSGYGGGSAADAAEPAAAEAPEPEPSEQALASSERQLARAPQLAVEVYDAEEAARILEQAEREKAEMDIIKAAVGTVFSVRKPRDAVAGTSSGLKTMARGVGVGLASLVVQPYVGAKCGGVKGFAKGCGTGLATCAASTVAGTVVGSGQIVRGVVNTPGAIFRAARGDVWNSETRSWEKDWYSLPEEAAEVLKSDDGATEGDEAAGAGSSVPGRPSRKVAERELYDILGVEPQASEAQIRKAFYKKSLALHPDKNPDNPEATRQFQAVSDAYRVLGDEERRRAYDEHGKDTAAAGLPKIEPVVFFAALFGTHHFEGYVGRLRLAQDIDGDIQSLMRDMVAAEDEDAAGQLDPLKVSRSFKRMKALELQRQVKCAVALAKRLEPVVEPSDEDQRAQAFEKWEAEHKAEAASLAKVPCGVEMLYLIGWLYCNGAEQWFAGSIAKRMMAKAQAQAHLAKSKTALATSAGRTALTVNKVVKTVEKKKLGSKPGGDEKNDRSGKDAESKDAESKAEGGPGSSTSGTADAKASCGGAADDASSTSASGPSKPPVSSPEEPPLSPGTVVLLANLRSNPELNDEVGVVELFDESTGRYVVHLLSDGFTARKLKRENLVVVEDPQQDAHAQSTAGGYSQAGGACSSSAPPPSSAGERAKEETSSRQSEDSGNSRGYAHPGGEDAEMAEAFKDTMPLFHDTLWGVTALDIEYTLSKVVCRVLRDMSVEKASRKRRAEALIRLGKIFQEPMKERRKEQSKGAAKSAEGVTSKEPTSPTSSSSKPEKGEKSLTNRSMLARLKPRTPWSKSSKSNSAEAKEAKSKDEEAKKSQFEAALALMAAGATTEDVDEMMAARSRMEAEFGGGYRG